MPTPKPRTNTPGRKRRMLGWTFITFGVFVAALWAASGWWCVEYRASTWRIWVGKGEAGYIWLLSPDLVSGSWHADYETGVDVLSRFTWWMGFEHRVDGGSKITVDCFGIGRVWRGFGGGEVALLLWPFPLLLWGAGIPFLRSGILARRRAMAGECKACGYDLAGLAAGAICPECGKGASVATDGPDGHR